MLLLIHSFREPALADESNRMKPFMPWCIFLPLLFVLITLLLTVAIYALVAFAILTTGREHLFLLDER